MKIIILEDHVEEQLWLCNEIRRTAKEINMEMDIILVSHNIEEIKKYLFIEREPAVLFLDIMIDNRLDGIALAKEVLKLYQQHEIVFISHFPELILYDMELKLNTRTIILKNSLSVLAELSNLFLHLNREQKDTHFMVTKYNQFVEKIFYADIIFIEKIINSSQVCINHINGYTVCKHTIKNLERALHKPFIRTTPSFIVNMEKVVKIDKRKRLLYLKGDFEVPISMLQVQKVVKSFYEFNNNN